MNTQSADIVWPPKLAAATALAKLMASVYVRDTTPVLPAMSARSTILATSASYARRAIRAFLCAAARPLVFVMKAIMAPVCVCPILDLGGFRSTFLDLAARACGLHTTDM